MKSAKMKRKAVAGTKTVAPKTTGTTKTGPDAPVDDSTNAPAWDDDANRRNNEMLATLAARVAKAVTPTGKTKRKAANGAARAVVASDVVHASAWEVEDDANARRDGQMDAFLATLTTLVEKVTPTANANAADNTAASTLAAQYKATELRREQP